MQKIKAKLVKQRIITSNICIDSNTNKTLLINMEGKTQLKTSKDKENNNSVLLLHDLNISSENREVHIELEAEAVFELSEIPDDYTVIAEKELVPMAREDLLNALDDILVIMGYNKMELAKQI